MSVRQEIKDLKTTKKDLRSFGLIVGGAFLVLGFFFVKNYSLAFSFLGGALVLLGVFAPAVLRPAHRAWMAFGMVIGRIMTTVILTVFFYAILTPLALALRTFGKKFLILNFRSQEASYWHKREIKSIDREALEKQF